MGGMIIYIYGLCDPDSHTVMYVGKTSSPDTRLKFHLREASNNSSAKDKWIQSLLLVEKNPVFTIIEECTEDNEIEREKHWIARHRTLNPSLTNRKVVSAIRYRQAAKSVTIKIEPPDESERAIINFLTPEQRLKVLVAAGIAKVISQKEKDMKFRKLDAWASTADAWAWTVLGGDLKQQAIDAVGENWAIDIQFGNVLGQLRTLGHSDLAQEIIDAIDAFNEEQEANEKRHKRKIELRKQYGDDEDAIDSILDREGL